MGRPSLFRDKKGGRRVQGIITRRGAELFEKHAQHLAAVTARRRDVISDADVIEYLSRGESDTLAYIARGARA